MIKKETPSVADTRDFKTKVDRMLMKSILRWALKVNDKKQKPVDDAFIAAVIISIYCIYQAYVSNELLIGLKDSSVTKIIITILTPFIYIDDFINRLRFPAIKISIDVEVNYGVC